MNYASSIPLLVLVALGTTCLSQHQAVGLRTVIAGVPGFPLSLWILKIKTDPVMKRWRVGLLHPSTTGEGNRLVPHKPLNYSIAWFWGVVKPCLKHPSEPPKPYWWVVTGDDIRHELMSAAFPDD